VAHDQTSSTGIDRRDGFLNKIANEYPNIKVVSVQYAAGVQLQPTEIAKATLAANPDLGGMFGTTKAPPLVL
jgi:ribose transport system substrate-binding protein